MAYKITDAKFVNEKIDLASFNLDTSTDLITQLETKTNEQRRLLKRIIKGKEQIKSGRFLIDNMDLVNPRFVKSRTTFINPDSYFERFVPTKFLLILTTLFNSKFYRNARLNTITNKYNYLDFKKSGTNLTVSQLKEQLDKTINEYILKEGNEEAAKIAELNQRLLKFNLKKANEFEKYHDLVLKVVSKSYFDELVKLNNYNLMLRFSQALYDDVYNFGNLRNSCTCEYNVKNSLNRVIRKSKNELSYKETKYVVLRQLKYLGIRISEFRIKVLRQSRLVSQLHHQLKIEINKRKNMKIKNFDKNSINNFLDSWRQLIDDQSDIYKQKQKSYLANVLTKKSYLIARTLIIYIHTYHQKVLSQSIKFESRNDFKIGKEQKKAKLISIWKQAVDYNKKELQEYGIKMDWFLKSTFKVSSLNSIFSKILRSINLRKKNIIFTDFIKTLNYQDFEKLLSVIKKIKEKRPDFSFVMMQSQLEKLPFLDKPIYAFKKKDFKEVNLADEITNDYKEFKKELFNNAGIKYNYDNGRIYIDNKKYLWSGKKLRKSGTFFVNPFSFEIKFVEPTSNDKVSLLVNIKKATNFNDLEMYVAKAPKSKPFYFYNNSGVELDSLSSVWLCFSLDQINI